ncbi:MAG: radical SAM protein [Oscillospiraceae bacterium]|nr:radical SAM protein [Oscillospiraceae bacterium]
MNKTLGCIERKTLLYKTGVEYGDYTLNHVQGCSHGCKYPCYAFLLAKRFGKVKTYEEWIEPKIVTNAHELLEKEIPKLKQRIESVHLCFTTDPFMYGYDDICKMSFKIISTLNKSGIKCTALTKGLLPLELADLSDENEYGITLISLDEKFRERIEPGAVSYVERIKRLWELHERGCKTWVSIEPYPTPNIIEQELNEILEAVSFVDKIIFGRTNYNKEISSYKKHKAFYNELSEVVIEFCLENDIAYHIKDGTQTPCMICSV